MEIGRGQFFPAAFIRLPEEERFGGKKSFTVGAMENGHLPQFHRKRAAPTFFF